MKVPGMDTELSSTPLPQGIRQGPPGKRVEGDVGVQGRAQADARLMWSSSFLKAPSLF